MPKIEEFMLEIAECEIGSNTYKEYFSKHLNNLDPRFYKGVILYFALVLNTL